MAKLLTIPKFAKQYGVSQRTLYNLTRKVEVPDYFVQDEDHHWFIDVSKAGAKKLMKEGAPPGEPVTAGESAGRRVMLQKAREDRAIADAHIKQFKAAQEKIKLDIMTGEYVDVGLMRYYFSFFQRGISDSFAAIKKISDTLKRLYAADKDKEAEKVFLTELGICFSNAVRALEDEIADDMGKKEVSKKPRKTP
ncbi:MAG: hypothetical protein LBK62_12350 [Treponema sp.]|jgi:hypothetical protein|nr:hypothetical protein [Treponema sp.]